MTDAPNDKKNKSHHQMTNKSPLPPSSSSKIASTTPPSFSPVSHALAGAVGSALALLLLYPLERVRIELQAQVAASTAASSHDTVANDDNEEENENEENRHNKTRHIRRILVDLLQRGELYTGALPIVSTLFVSNFVFFGLKSLAQQQLTRIASLLLMERQPKSNNNNNNNDQTTILINFVSSLLAGVGNVLLTNPLWVTNLRIVTQQATHQNLWRELAHRIQTQPLRQLWQGTSSSLLLVSNPVLQMVVYEQVRRRLLQLRQSGNTSRRRGRPQTTVSSQPQSSSLSSQPQPPLTLSPASAFCVGALSKALATFVTYPLQLAQACQRLENNHNNNNNNSDHRQQEQEQTENPDQTNSNTPNTTRTITKNTTTLTTWACLRLLYQRAGGVHGWYTGFQAKCLQTVLTAAFQFLTYEQILRAIHHSLQQVVQSSSS